MATSVKGNVSRLYVDNGGCYIRLADIPSADRPKSGYFRLRLSHPNYNALYSLALTAATNGLELRIRIDGTDISPNKRPDVNYMTVDWPQ
jgi:hypothetical protein